jgi:protease stability complex PrcB-like protein
MNPRWFAMLIPLAALAGCAGGSTLRVAEGDDTTSAPVALAPAPEPGPDSSLGAPSGTAAAPVPVQDTVPNASPSAQGYAPYGGVRDLEVRRIGQWSHTGVGEARRMVIRDANAWAQFWSEIGSGDRPDVDFTQNIVVAAAAGQRSTGGYDISVSRVSQTDGELAIEVVETNPGPNCVTAGSATQPVDVVVVPVVAPRSWNFIERKEIRACR